MKRSGPPERRTPLRSGGPLSRSGELRRTPMKRTAMKRKRKPPDPAWTEARRTVLDRDRVCQRHPDMPGTCFGALHVHHIKRRSQGGTDDPWNLVALCPVHHGWVHEHPEMARRMGLLA